MECFRKLVHLQAILSGDPVCGDLGLSSGSSGKLEAGCDRLLAGTPFRPPAPPPPASPNTARVSAFFEVLVDDAWVLNASMTPPKAIWKRQDDTEEVFDVTIWQMIEHYGEKKQ